MATISQVQKLTSREVQRPAQSHTASEWQSWDLNLDSLSLSTLPTVLSSCANSLSSRETLRAVAADRLLPATHARTHARQGPFW